MGLARAQVADPGGGLARESAGPSDRHLSNPRFLARLHEEVLTDPDAEYALTEARRRMCLDPPSTPPPVARAIAAQGSLNEYAWSVTEEEAAATATAPAWVRAMYHSSEPDHDLLDRARCILSLTAVIDGTSTVVRQMYEENPYPRWHRLRPGGPQELGEWLCWLTGGAFEPPEFLRRPHLLVAGCGTGREMLAAARAWRPASVTGLDLSRASLAFAQRMAEQLGLEVALYQADLLELGDWDRRFDVIVCTGVLHHLDDPLAGWRTLERLLRPGGVMLIGLYSTTARRGVGAARALVRDAGWPPTPEGIRQARALVMSLPAEHPGRDCTRLGDFYFLSGARDMLFHVREHTFTLPNVAASLDELGLEFLGFHTDDDIRRLYLTLFGAEQKILWWDTLERLYPRLFLGMYQFWCRKPARHPTSGSRPARSSAREEGNHDHT